ncbi:transmembrane protein 126A-like [Clavelina lepadiformis]|uniref:Uncharacterized protein n=1 Tax=Clavelina lepadiformis TaxID=159417 RepID=A0ABP0G7Z9_CLALP
MSMSNAPAQRFLSLRELLVYKISQLDQKDRRWFDNLVPLNAVNVVSALVINTTARKSLLLYESFLFGSAAISIFTCAMSNVFQFGLLQVPMTQGKLSCPSCAITRGCLVQALAGFVTPTLFSIAFNAISAERYKSAAIPDLSSKNFKSFWREKLRYMGRYTWAVLAIQVMVGGFLAYRQYKVVENVKGTITQEECQELVKEAFSQLHYY